jgi:hypothetical protein
MYNKRYFFERNLLALSRVDPLLCSRLSGAETTFNRYRFLESRTGEIIPAWVEPSGAAHPLHSMIDPRREGRRLVESATGEGFLILLGLGGAYCAEAALERDDIHRVLVIDFDLNSMAELLCSREYITLFNDPRFFLMVDPGKEDVEDYIVRSYQPCLFGGIRVLPLRTRTAFGREQFAAAGSAVEAAIGRISADYSVQAFFGTRWFSNILRNLKEAEKPEDPLPPIRRAAVTAAGPSLDRQIPALKKKREGLFLIAADTSLPCLLAGGIRPDAVISIDCQHYSYYHFMEGLPGGILLFVDLASPPLVASRSARPRFFSGGHPLARYLSRTWRPLPELDTSGANVTYAAVSLAEKLGARTIELYGADFSYPMGLSYARGAYVYPLFEKDQNRLAPLEKKVSSLLFRSPLEKVYTDRENWRYETQTLNFYRKKLEEKSLSLEARLVPEEGMGPRLNMGTGTVRENPLRLFSSGAPRMGAAEFLSQYRDAVSSLPPFIKDISRYLQNLGDEEHILFTTLLPAAAALKRRNPLLEVPELLETDRRYSLGEIDRVLSQSESTNSRTHLRRTEGSRGGKH